MTRYNIEVRYMVTFCREILFQVEADTPEAAKIIAESTHDNFEAEPPDGCESHGALETEITPAYPLTRLPA